MDIWLIGKEDAAECKSADGIRRYIDNYRQICEMKLAFTKIAERINTSELFPDITFPAIAICRVTNTHRSLFFY